jgi:hypothetical protein
MTWGGGERAFGSKFSVQSCFSQLHESDNHGEEHGHPPSPSRNVSRDRYGDGREGEVRNSAWLIVSQDPMPYKNNYCFIIRF